MKNFQVGDRLPELKVPVTTMLVVAAPSPPGTSSPFIMIGTPPAPRGRRIFS